MGRVLVKDIDALADDVVRVNPRRKQVRDLAKRLEACFVDVSDVEGIGIANHDIGRQQVDDLTQGVGLRARCLGGGLRLRGWGRSLRGYFLPGFNFGFFNDIHSLFLP